jgi:phage-related protein
MTIKQDLQASALPNLIELFTLDMTPIGGSLLYFTPNTMAGQAAVVFGGNTYTPMPVTGSGWETSIDGAAPQPSLRVSNVTKYIQGYLASFKDLVGARVTRQQTFPQYLDGLSFVRRNLLNQSQTPASNVAGGWTKQSVTTPVTNLTAPDGSATGTYMREVATTPSSPYFYITQGSVAASPNTLYTFSAHLKAQERTFANLRFDDSAGVNTVAVGINLTTGVAGTPLAAGNVSNASVQVTDAGNGWWRVALTAKWSAISLIRCFVRPAIGSGAATPGDLGYAGDITKGIQVWGMQLEQAATASAYQPTTTVQINPTADANQVFGMCVYVIEQKTKQNKNEVEFKLASIIDTPQLKLPRGQVLRSKSPAR